MANLHYSLKDSGWYPSQNFPLPQAAPFGDCRLLALSLKIFKHYNKAMITVVIVTMRITEACCSIRELYRAGEMAQLANSLL